MHQYVYDCRCRRKCFEKVPENDRLDIFTRLHDMKTKDEQDIFIQGLINVHTIQRRRPRKESARSNSAAFKYNVFLQNKRQEVCLTAFLSILAVSAKRVKRIKQLSVAGKSPQDRRGKHPCPKRLPDEVRDTVRQHIESFPTKNSHYAGRPVKYLDAKLNLKIMFDLFKQRHPNVKVSYQFYYHYFKENFKLSFGRPQVDSCCLCEELKLKLKSPHINEANKRCAAAELSVHLRRSRKFYSSLKAEIVEGNKNPNILAIAMDYMQNIQLPVTPVQELFYLRQLTVNMFCIHDIKNNLATLYLYHEGIAKKSPNEVCSFLFDFLRDVPNNIDELHVYSDNCGGQNKNHSLIRFFLALTDTGRFKKIEHIFPIRGHSYLPCDRDFSMISRVLKKNDRIYNIHDITTLIVSSSKSHKFTVKEIHDSSDITDYKTWWLDYYKRTCLSEETVGRAVPRDQKVHFNIQSFHQFIYASERRGCVVAQPFINSLVPHTFRLSHSRCPRAPILPLAPAYPLGKVPINEKKLKDIRKLMPYIPEEEHAFYEDILSWPTVQHNDDDDP